MAALAARFAACNTLRCSRQCIEASGHHLLWRARQGPTTWLTTPSTSLSASSLRRCTTNEAASSAAGSLPQQPDDTHAPAPAPPAVGTPAGDEHFMRLALEQAALAYDALEVPVGAVLVSPAGDVLAAAHNQTERSSNPTAHAEMLCIQQAATQLGGWRLLDATLYVTLEPCPMCAGALLQSRVGTVVYGARNTLLGADGSWIAMLPSDSPQGSGSGNSCSHGAINDGDEQTSPSATAAAPAKPHPFHPNLQVRRGVLAEECAGMMRSFFAMRRRQSAAAKTNI